MTSDDQTPRPRVKRHSYRDGPGVDAHATWTAGDWPSVAVAFESIALEPFFSQADSIQLAGLTVQYATGSGRVLSRPVHRLRDGLDHLVVGVQFDAAIEVLAAGRTCTVPPGAVLLLDLMQSVRVTMPANRSIQLAIPRALAEAHLGPVRPLHGRMISAETGALLVDHLQSLRGVLPAIKDEQTARLARILLELLAVALGQSDRFTSLAMEAQRPRAEQTRRDVEAALAARSSTIAGVCLDFGLSRSTLSRMFKGEGGVEAHRRTLRLARVRAALLDPDDGEKIGALAHRWGFSDASHLTRAFRQRYGVTPSAVRAGLRAIEPDPD